MLTKPAGVFLQLVAVVVMLGGCMEGMAKSGQGESGVFGWSIFVLGVVLLYIGGLPSRRKS